MDVLSRNAGRRSLLVGFAAGGVLACAIAAGAWILTDGAAPKSAKPELTFRLQVEAAQLGANRFWLDANLLADNRSDELPEKLLAISWWVALPPKPGSTMPVPYKQWNEYDLSSIQPHHATMLSDAVVVESMEPIVLVHADAISSTSESGDECILDPRRLPPDGRPPQGNAPAVCVREPGSVPARCAVGRGVCRAKSAEKLVPLPRDARGTSPLRYPSPAGL